MAEPVPVAPERRRIERRTNPTLAELTLPELRRMLVTTIIFVTILILFLWMVRNVIIAAILGVIVASFTRPLYLWLMKRMPNKIVAATITLCILILPVLALSVYSYKEIADVASYPWVLPERQSQNIGEFPHLKRWKEAIKARPATERAYALGKEINPKPAATRTDEERKILFGQTKDVVR